MHIVTQAEKKEVLNMDSKSVEREDLKLLTAIQEGRTDRFVNTEEFVKKTKKVKVLVDESFEKDVKRITDKKLLNQIADCIEEIIETDKLSIVSACKKLTGSKNAYRIRIGN